MRVRNIKNKDEILEHSSYVIKKITDDLTNNKLSIEIGMGKGNFIRTLSANNPTHNFIGIEKNASILSLAINKTEDNIPNLKYMNIDAKDIDNVFNHNVSTLYLNFSDPWPKKRHVNRRLTSPFFLDKYDKIFKDDQVIIMKTDNQNLFLYSLVTFTNHGYKIDEISLDLHNSNILNEAFTEYEMKFSKDNLPIYYVRVSKILSK